MLKLNKDLIIAVDGHSSCGKSTFAKQIAALLSYTYIDTGAMYRAATLYFIRKGVVGSDGADESIMAESIGDIDIKFHFNSLTKKSETLLNGENVESIIRTSPEVADLVSIVSKVPKVREHMVFLQRNMGNQKRIVMDGRDIGSVVFPNADLKIFLTAHVDVRARRRYDELLQKGITTSLQEVKENLETRDRIDSSREHSPLVIAENAIVIDNSSMTREEQLEWITPHIIKAGQGLAS